MKRARLLLYLLAIAWCLAFPGAIPARAHAYLVRSDPAANSVLPATPAVLQLWFTEEPELRFTQVEVYNTSRVLVQQAPLQLAPEDRRLVIARLEPLPDGIYTVIWRALSTVDGHTTVGAFGFGIGLGQEVTGPVSGLLTQSGPATRPTPTGAVVRWLTYLAVAGMLGAVTFPGFVLGPTLALLRRKVEGDSGWTQAIDRSVARGTLRLAWWSLWLNVVLAGAAAAVQASIAAGVPLGAVFSPAAGRAAPLQAILLETRYGQIWFGRVLILLFLALVLWLLLRPHIAASRRRQLWLLAIGAATLYPLTISLNSHAAALSPSATVGAPFVPIMIDWIHLVATGVWVGGLFVLVFVLPSGLQAAGVGRRLSVLGSLVPAFSRVASVAVVVLTLTGVYQSAVHVGSLDALFGTPYGQSLVIKLALIVPLFLLALFNFAYAQPRLARAVAHPIEDHSGIRLSRLFTIAVRSEVVLSTAVLLTVGVLTLNPPARDAWAEMTRGITLQKSADGLRLRLRVNPGEPGFNAFSVQVLDRNGRPADGVQRVAIVLTMVEHDMGENEIVLQPEGNGTFTAETGLASMIGTWRGELIVRRQGRGDVRTSFEFKIDQTQTADPTLAPGAQPGQPAAPAAARSLVNPIPATEESFVIGRQIYQQSCAVCHGVTGKGDGPAARTLRPPPADLSVHVTQHTPGELWWWITNGIPGTAMPAWRDALTDEERWHLVNYIIQAFSPPTR